MATKTVTTTVPSITVQSNKPQVFNDFSRHPPTEKFNTLDGLLRSHAAEVQQKPLVCYPDRGVSDFQAYTAKDIDAKADIAARFYVANGMKPADPSLDKPPVVAVLAPSSFEIVVTIFALNRLGWSILFLSTRLTARACVRLLDLADCSTIIASEPSKQISLDICIDRPECTRIPLLQRSDHEGKSVLPYFRFNVDSIKESKKLAWILHSSGSTGFPKPIFLTNMQCLANFRKSFAMRAFCVSPLFHGHALNEFGRAFYTQATMYLGNFAFPVTSQNLIEAITVAKPELVSAVPYVLKLLAEKPEGVRTLARAKIVVFAGSSCPDELGDRLVAQGVNLVANYGATETGQIMTSFRLPGDKEWSYMRLHRPVADHTLMDEIAPGVFECVALDGLPSKGPSNSAPPYSAKNPMNSYRTADLFIRHPDPWKSNYWRYLSRLDDRIGLVNGEKVLPIPIEGSIRQDDLVREAVVFGIVRAVPGVLIFRSEQHGAHLSDKEYVDAVWPAVEAANAKAETFSRIPKDMVVVQGKEVTYPKTDKATFIRAQVYQQFASEIDRAYMDFETGNNQSDGLRLDIQELEGWLLSKFRIDLGVPLPSIDTDIFSAGVDSLQTTRIWRMIKKDLDLGEGGKTMSQNVVFEQGTVRALAFHIYTLRTGLFGDEDTVNEVEMMQQLIRKYSSFPAHTLSHLQMPKKETIILTGATGNLGAFLLADFLSQPSVSEVWALIRAPTPAGAAVRVQDSLHDRNLRLPVPALAKLHCIPSDLSQPDLGLPPATLTHLLKTATTIVHSAWAVNFNLSVRSFESHHIRGTHNLLSFSLRSALPVPAKFFFCSSVSTGSGTPKPASIPERQILDLSHAQATGYGRSKLVTEHIVSAAARTTGMQARVLRIGQLSGDTTSAYWNDTEAVALMFRSATTIGALPALEERPSWLPVDVCAHAITQIALATQPSNQAVDVEKEMVYHLVNPRTFSWTKDLLPALHAHPAFPPFEIVSPAEWLQRLEASEPDVERNPPVKLLEFWKSKYAHVGTASLGGKDDEEREEKGLVFEITKTVQACPSLGLVRDPVTEGLVGKYVDVWLKRWSV